MNNLFIELKVAQAALNECVPMPGHSDPGAIQDCKNIVNEAIEGHIKKFPAILMGMFHKKETETMQEAIARYERSKCVKATIYFPGDPSVGIFAATYEMDLPFADESSLNDYGIEECREEIADMYFGLCDGGVKVYFDFEDVND